MPLLNRADITRVHVLTAVGVATLVAMLVRLATFDYSPDSSFFHPHGYCYLWQPDLVAAHVISDGLIGLSYIAISCTLIYLVRRAQRDLPFSWMFVAFGAFIIACGATHLMEIWTLWTPVFWLSADVKIITAVASVATAVLLPPLVPKVLDIVWAARLSEARRLELERAREELESRVAERTAALQAALDHAEEANRAKEAFLGIVSHELRTPLNAMLGWSHMLTQADPDPEFLSRGLSVIDRNARTQATLVEDLIDVSRMTAGTLHIRREPANLTQVVRDAVEVVRPAADARHIRLVVDDGEETTVVMGDSRRLQQVAWNLLSNSVKFTPEHGTVTITLRRARDRATIEVHDTGIGIDPAFLPRIFERFSQADPSSSRSYGGLGLGLSIVRHIVELHGGTIAASSRGAGTGTTFRVELPVSMPETDELAFPGAAPRLDGIRVLVIDDETDSRDMLRVLLERAGAWTAVADSSAVALAHLERSPNGFDVVVSDLAMPDVDGFAFVRALRSHANPALREMPAVALSALARDADRDTAIAAGFHLHLAKPVTPDDVVRGILAVLPDTRRPR